MKKLLFLAVLVGLYVYFARDKAPTEVPSQPVAVSAPVPSRAQAPVPTAGEKKIAAEEAPVPSHEYAIELTPKNFEQKVQECFRGEKCKFAVEPMFIFVQLAKKKNSAAIDNLISYMRRELSDPVFKAKYAGVLKNLIDSYYPQKELLFQQAAYYDYLGDRDLSLRLYLELEKNKENTKPIKLNIANVYYNLGKMREALPYYEAALDEFGSGQEAVAVLKFIDGRIAEIKSKIN